MADDPSKFSAQETGARNMASEDSHGAGFLFQSVVDNQLIK